MMSKLEKLKEQMLVGILCRLKGCIEDSCCMSGNMICSDIYLVGADKENFQLRIEYMIELCYNHYN
jgi:hypothetical protein